jgi:methionyl-tRNA formyltransferase
VAAYGLILPTADAGGATLGCLNIHASLLPRWRGAAPIHAAILAGDSETGITIMRMDEGLDTGPMLLREAVPIPPRPPPPSMHDALALMGARLILTALSTPSPRAGAATGGGRRDLRAETVARRRADRLDPDAASIERRIRAFDPWPGTFSTLDGAVLKILSAVVADGSRSSRHRARRRAFAWPAAKAHCD